MNRSRAVGTSCPTISFFAALLLISNSAGAISLEFVPVGDPGNPRDTRHDTPGYGAVDYEYSISKYEITNSQYREFLNAKAALGDPNSLYHERMGQEYGGIQRIGTGIEGDPFVYVPKEEESIWDSRPVNYVGVWDAARFINWLSNGQGDGDTESGSYINLGAPFDFQRVPGKTYYLPTENEWYKAAYYDPEKNDGEGSYWEYPTQSNVKPLQEQPPGSDLLYGSANYNGSMSTPVGSFTAKPSVSAYGTYDQGGNVWEWNETLVTVTFFGLRGGSFHDFYGLDAGHRNSYPANFQNAGIGFRVVAVPEPATVTLALIGLLTAAGTLAKRAHRTGWRSLVATIPRLRARLSPLRLESLEDRSYLSAVGTTSEFRANSHLPGVQFNTITGRQFVDTDAQGNFIIVWQSENQAVSGYDIFARRFDAQGTPLTGELLINTSTFLQQQYPAVAMTDDGRFVVTWSGHSENGASQGVFVRQFMPNGTPASGEILVNSTPTGVQGKPNIAMAPDDEFIITWTGEFPTAPGIFGQRFDSAAQPLGSEIQISTTAGDNSSVAIAYTGEFVVAWDMYAGTALNDFDVRARRFAPDGAPLGGEFNVNAFNLRSQQQPSIAIDENGKFLIAWTSQSAFGETGPNAYARLFELTGVPSGDEFRVNDLSGAWNPDVDYSSAVGFLVAWDGASSTDSHGILARTYDAAGIEGPIFRVNEQLLGQQFVPAVALDRDGNAIVVWSSSGSVNVGYDVQGRRFAADDLRPHVLDRHIFYNQSYYDAALPTANKSDDSSVAPDKDPLLPGQTASFANYTSYSRGINGIMIDVRGLVNTPTLGDFTFRMGNSNNLSTWIEAPSPTTIAVRPNNGVAGSDRVTLVWPNGAITNRWLQITMHANANTGLAASDVFYFGNAIGESGNSRFDAGVTVSDEVAARNNPHSAIPFAAPLTNPWDYNRDCRVTASDQIIARNDRTTVADRLKLITPPPNLAASGLISSHDETEVQEQIARTMVLRSVGLQGVEQKTPIPVAVLTEAGLGITSRQRALSPQGLAASYEGSTKLPNRKLASETSTGEALLDLI